MQGCGGAGSRGMGRASASESPEAAALPLACTERKMVRERWGGTWAVGLLDLGCQWGPDMEDKVRSKLCFEHAGLARGLSYFGPWLCHCPSQNHLGEFLFPSADQLTCLTGPLVSSLRSLENSTDALSSVTWEPKVQKLGGGLPGDICVSCPSHLGRCLAVWLNDTRVTAQRHFPLLSLLPGSPVLLSAFCPT